MILTFLNDIPRKSVSMSIIYEVNREEVEIKFNITAQTRLNSSHSASNSTENEVLLPTHSVPERDDSTTGALTAEQLDWKIVGKSSTQKRQEKEEIRR